jgi:uncharacterized protein YdeI (YjbR/CyaY-like superfamily)
MDSTRHEMKSGFPVMSMANEVAFVDWLAAHPDAPGIWLRFPKKGASWSGIDKHQALDVALCHGWIDGQAAKGDDDSFLMRFTPRRQRSMGSQINCARAESLIAQGRMGAAGFAQIASARADGRWDMAYPSPSTLALPHEVSMAFNSQPAAAARFHALPKAQRYALVLAIVIRKKPETRARKAIELVERLMSDYAVTA